MRNNMKNYNSRDNMWFKAMLNLKVWCKCGHSIVMKYNEEGKICTFCGKYVPNKRKEFKEKLKSMLGEDENEK